MNFNIYTFVLKSADFIDFQNVKQAFGKKNLQTFRESPPYKAVFENAMHSNISQIVTHSKFM